MNLLLPFCICSTFRDIPLEHTSYTDTAGFLVDLKCTLCVCEHIYFSFFEASACICEVGCALYSGTLDSTNSSCLLRLNVDRIWAYLSHVFLGWSWCCLSALPLPASCRIELLNPKPWPCLTRLYKMLDIFGHPGLRTRRQPEYAPSSIEMRTMSKVYTGSGHKLRRQISPTAQLRLATYPVHSFPAVDRVPSCQTGGDRRRNLTFKNYN